MENKTMRLIGLEEHFLTPAFLEGPGISLKKQAQSADPQVAGRYTKLINKSAISMMAGWPLWMPPVSICRYCDCTRPE